MLFLVLASVDMLKGTSCSCLLFHNKDVASFMVETSCVCVSYGCWLFLASDLWICPDLLKSIVFKVFGLLPPHHWLCCSKTCGTTSMRCGLFAWWKFVVPGWCLLCFIVGAVGPWIYLCLRSAHTQFIEIWVFVRLASSFHCDFMSCLQPFTHHFLLQSGFMLRVRFTRLCLCAFVW